VDVVYQDDIVYIRVCKLIMAMIVLLLLHPTRSTSSGGTSSDLLENGIGSILGVNSSTNNTNKLCGLAYTSNHMKQLS